MHTIHYLALVFCLLLPAMANSAEPNDAHVATVKRFMAAFNAHDSQAMATLVTDDISWLSIAGEQTTVETKGKAALIASMNAYFSACGTCRSELASVIATPYHVSVIEIAHWQGKTAAQSQQALAVYEFTNGLIHRVYYFPALP